MARLVIAVSRFVMTGMNRLQVHGRERLDDVAPERKGRGLLTVSNHVSLFDDPLLLANFVRGPYRDLRWVGADAINFFGSAPKAWLFTAGRGVPIIRGAAGIDQPGMRFLRDRLLEGEWVHMFPEGGRTRDPEARMLSEFRGGTGWLIAETKPVVLPFYHYGMHRVLPVSAVRPRSGNTVEVRFGEQVDCDKAWAGETALRRVGHAVAGVALWDALAAELRDRLHEIERQTHPALSGAQ
jgi:monolysocardiolipin acyltransferase